ncbi:GNAT family N-acetyltransferase [Patiriisocius hiemis]|uniref:GNAT family N-acetyltransferase n=1 Tax=Patiriisocius hiemis TaxID=3075604 RepID=A0ABU2YGA5_9FLAO|nr:GNAT family N-acetyltransferase [Constantimarinum sp. W242]MDT0556724.1 GNAT family N-acetyltransferase [Constantimarinum sp. W242]
MISHAGLTYGGIIHKPNEYLEVVESVFHCLLEFLKSNDFLELRVKLPPYFYHTKYTTAQDFLFFINGVNSYKRDINFVVPLNNINLHKSKSKAQKNGTFSSLELKEEDSLDAFWNSVLIPVLKTNYNSTPVHSLEEIKLLKQKFPTNIVQFNAYQGENIVAGMTLFISGKVVKSQYGVVTTVGKKYKALDYIYLELYKKYKELGYLYFDLGTTTTKDGYNSGLTRYKEELGGNPVNLDYYSLKI